MVLSRTKDKVYKAQTEKTKTASLAAQRNYGIDLLRLVSMFYVVVLHTLRQGGISEVTETGTSQYIVNWFLQIFSYGAVNIFALISGYVLYSEKEKPVRYSGYFNLWFQVVFYGCVIGLILNIYNTEWVTKETFIKMFFPFSNYLYWYFTVYTALFFISPFINAGIRGCSRKNLKLVFVSLFLICSVWEIVFSGQKLNNGYSFAWLLVVYILGGIIKKCEIGKNLKPALAFLGIVVLVLAGLLWKLYGVEFVIFDKKITQNTFINYVSPLILGAAMLHIILFSKIRLKNPFKKIIAYLSPCAFAVYLLNTQYYVWNNIIKGAFTSWAEKEWYVMALLVICFSVAFVLGSIFIDRIRMFIFRLFFIDKLSLAIDRGINKVISKVVKDDM